MCNAANVYFCVMCYVLFKALSRSHMYNSFSDAFALWHYHSSMIWPPSLSLALSRSWVEYEWAPTDITNGFSGRMLFSTQLSSNDVWMWNCLHVCVLDMDGPLAHYVLSLFWTFLLSHSLSLSLSLCCPWIPRNNRGTTINELPQSHTLLSLSLSLSSFYLSVSMYVSLSLSLSLSVLNFCSWNQTIVREVELLLLELLAGKR